MKKGIAAAVVSLVMSCVSVPGFAGGASEDAKVAQTRESFSALHQQVLKDLADGETYKEIDPGKKLKVRESLDRIQALFDERATFSAMSGEEQRRVANDQETINTILTQAREDSRITCKREKRLGSHRAETQCMTVAQRRIEMNRARDNIPEMQRTPRMSQDGH